MPKGSTSKSSEPNHSSLSSIVSHLVRSQLGSSASSSTTPLSSVPDSELDKHVAELLLAEAKSKDKQWKDSGVRAYYDQQKESTAPLRKPNTRFLGAMLKNVDDHNAALRRQEAEQQRKRDRQEREEAEEWRKSQGRGKGKEKEKEKETLVDDERERRRRRRRREELGLSASEDEGANGVTRRTREGSSREEIDERPSASTSKENGRSSTSRREDRESSRRSRDERSASPGSSRRRKRTEDDSRESSRRNRHDSSRSHHRRRRSRSRDEEDDKDRHRSRRRRDDDSERAGKGDTKESHSSSREKGKRREKDPVTEEDERPLEEVFADVEKQVTSKERKRSHRSPSVSLPSSAPPLPPSVPLPSKMDKYFSPTYDPLLDFTPAQLTDSTTGLIGEGGFDEWDRMLSTMKRRKEDKKEVEWREKEERRRERDKKRKERRRKRGESVSESDSEDEKGGKGIMDMKYSKKGSTREWDLGKENPT